MHDIRLIRDDPEAFDAAMAQRGLEPQAEQILDYDGSARAFQTDIQRKQAEKNELAKFAAEVRHFYSNTSYALFSSLLDVKLHVLVELTDDLHSSYS